MNKIFVIGLSKTATNSVCIALEDLGLSMIHYPGPNLFGDINHVDGAADLPTVRYFKELNLRFPGSKFILTVRPLDSWLKSVESHFKRRTPDTLSAWGKECREVVYGSMQFDRALFREKYMSHLDEVQEYFKDRPQDLIHFNVFDGDGWSKLMTFVGADGPVPEEPFPTSNVDPQHQPLVDVVYPYYDYENHDELRYSLRALAQNFTTLGNVWLIGDKPDWVSDEVRYIEFDHTAKLASHEDAKNRNIAEKMAKVAMMPYISMRDNVVYIADDHFILKPWSGDDFRRRILVREDLNAYPDEFKNPRTRPVEKLTEWQRSVWWTYDHLRAEGYYGWNFETHTPKLVSRQDLVQTFMKFGTKYGKLLWQTAHFNMHWKVRKATLSDPSDIKAGFYEPHTREQIDQRLEHATFANWNEQGYTKDLTDAMMERFPVKCMFER